MADTISPASGRRYSVARVCQVWEVARSSFYAAQQAGAADAGPTPSPCPRGPKPAVSDADLLAAIRADLARSPDGSWWVLADRTGGPSGAGYALQNRMTICGSAQPRFSK